MRNPSDKTRQWGKTLEEIRRDHVQRYLFASNMAEGRVLDLACGCGYGSKVLHDAGFEVLGGDICQEALDRANEHYPGPEYKLMTCESPEKGFDTLVTFETLEHIKNPAEFIAKADCGLVICSVPNQEKYPFYADRFVEDEYPHLRHYTPREFEALLYEAGYTVSEKWCQVNKHGDISQGTDGMFLIYIAE